MLHDEHPYIHLTHDVFEGVREVKRKGLHYLKNGCGVCVINIWALRVEGEGRMIRLRQCASSDQERAECVLKTFSSSLRSPLRTVLWDGVQCEVIYSHCAAWVFINTGFTQPFNGFYDFNTLGDEALINLRDYMKFANSSDLDLRLKEVFRPLSRERLFQTRLSDYLTLNPEVTDNSHFWANYPLSSYGSTAFALEKPFCNAPDTFRRLDRFEREVAKWSSRLVTFLKRKRYVKQVKDLKW